MVRRAIQLGYGLWSMPGGHVGRGEVVEEAAAREVQEETGLVVKIDGLVGLFSEAGNPVMVAVFAAHEVGGLLHPGPETLEVGSPPLAFPRDEEILGQWRDALRPRPGGLGPKVGASSPFRVSLPASIGCVFGPGRKRTLCLLTRIFAIHPLGEGYDPPKLGGGTLGKRGPGSPLIGLSSHQCCSDLAVEQP